VRHAKIVQRNVHCLLVQRLALWCEVGGGGKVAENGVSEAMLRRKLAAKWNVASVGMSSAGVVGKLHTGQGRKLLKWLASCTQAGSKGQRTSECCSCLRSTAPMLLDSFM
jgi:hypothetical protein